MVNLFSIGRVSLAASKLHLFWKEESKESVQSHILAAASALPLHNITILFQVLTGHVFAIYQLLHYF